MISKKLNMAAAIVAVAAIGVFAAGCGDDSSSNTDQLKQEANKAIDQATQQGKDALDNAKKQAE
ncbi:MAG: hypothetical protein M3Y45_10775, partial [Actinomycetota bacterium]|nr:hypothetical protein [Actinomycetota bacterium]